MEITSPRSPRVLEVRLLHDRRHRAERGAFVVEGPQAVTEALAWGRVREVFATAAAVERHGPLLANAPLTLVGERALGAMAETRQPQGVLAVCDLASVELTDLPAQPRQVVVLDRIGDPGNAGSIIRTADAVGADAVILTEGSVDPHNGKCVRSTAGSLFHVPVVMDADPGAVVATLRDAGVTLLATDASGDVALGSPEADRLLAGPVAWLMGSEAHGLAPSLREAADVRIGIPMAGRAESLNVAAAAAICLWTACQAH